jgi:YesN/AraC family two-component response regulator
VLLVDDDRDFRHEIGEALDGYAVTEASNGEQALDILKKPHEIDLIMLDVNLPGRSGTQLLARIREITPNVGIIIITGYGSKDVVLAAFRGDADEYIEKPIDIEKTKQIIADVLEEKRGIPDVNTVDIENKVERVKQFAARNYDKKVSLDDAAKVVCLSPKYLSRVFKRMTGVGFSDFKLSVKTEKAKKLLVETGMSVEQLAYELGYQNAESFIRIFKKTTGVTPATFRRKQKN